MKPPITQIEEDDDYHFGVKDFYERLRKLVPYYDETDSNPTLNRCNLYLIYGGKYRRRVGNGEGDDE